MKKSSPATPTRAPRSDGQETKRALLLAAGPVFAQKGFARATSKEICELAGADLAAVNYHFGSKGGLYQAVLADAHAQLLSVEELQQLSRREGSPRSRLEGLIRLMMGRAEDRSQGWGLRVLAQEILAPSEHVPPVLRSAVLPKAQIIYGLVSAVLELPPEHPAVQRGIAFVMMPCFMLSVVPAQLRQAIVPSVGQDMAATLDDLLAYVFAGLAALRARHAPKR